MRKEGKEPGNFGIADDLPTKVVYENLLSLKGMSQKVQQVIEHNEQLFRRRIQLEERALLQKAWDAWREKISHNKLLRDKTRKAMNKILKGVLARTFYAWKDKFKMRGERGG